MLKQPYAIASVTDRPVHRGGATQPAPPVEFKLSAGTISYSWGSEPGEATLVYDLESGAPVTSGWSLTIRSAGYIFTGVCISDCPKSSSSGKTRELRFQDNRHWLDYDRVFFSFNVLDDHIVNNVRVKRYVHITPNNYPGLIKTYTDAPYTVSEMLDMIFDSNYVEDSWVPIYHADQIAFTVYDFNAYGGKSLKSILQELSDAQGLLFTLHGGPYRLEWQRKGDITYPAPTLPLDTHPVTGEIVSLTDNRSDGTALSNHPTRICILGDRNLYQFHEITMVPDWKSGWEEFYDINLFREDIFNRGKTVKTVTIDGQVFNPGTLFTVIASSGKDPEQIISRQLALACSLEISVIEYATLRADLPHFADYRRFAGKTRIDMPATLYIEALLFRAFRFPDGFSVTNKAGITIPVDSLEVASKMVARVTHDALTGVMTWDYNQCSDGNGYAIIQGYQVGKDLFKTINPDRFRLSDWTDAQSVWERAEFQVDDSGQPEGKLILFNEPVIKSSNLVKIVNGYGVFNAAPTKTNGDPGFDAPTVKLAITFAAERYQSYWGTGTRDEVESIGGLNAEYVGKYGSLPATFLEVPYADAKLSDEKAYQFATPLLARQFVYEFGGYTRAILPQPDGTYATGQQITPKLDRISLSVSSNGVRSTTEFTTELPKVFFIPERDMDRNTKLKTLLPGQQNLRNEINTAKLFAAALQQSPVARKTISDAFKGIFGHSEPLYTVHL